MIRPLRRRHLRSFAVLTLTLPVGFAAAILARPTDPIVESLPQPLGASRPVPGDARVDLPALLAEHDVEASIRVQDDAAHLVMRFDVDPKRPDVLVYAARASSAKTESGLPEGATLLGTLAGTRERVFRLPAWVFDAPAQLVLYSLPHQEVVDRGDLPVVER